MFVVYATDLPEDITIRGMLNKSEPDGVIRSPGLVICKERFYLTLQDKTTIFAVPFDRDTVADIQVGKVMRPDKIGPTMFTTADGITYNRDDSGMVRLVRGRKRYTIHAGDMVVTTLRVNCNTLAIYCNGKLHTTAKFPPLGKR